MDISHNPITDSVIPGAVFNFIYTFDYQERLDLYLVSCFPRYSRSFLQQLIKQGFVLLNGQATKKACTSLKIKDCVTITFPNNKPYREPRLAAAEFNITIIHESDDFLIINKPAGILIHPPHASSSALSLIDWIVLYDTTIKNVGTVDRPGIVHRLDRDTSGLLIIPRTTYAHTIFGNLFRDHAIKKTYYAFVHGHPPSSGTMTYTIGRDPSCPVKMRAFSPHDSSKRTATTSYRVHEYYHDSSLLELKPVTGRTHQIRVHCSTLGHPLIGDAVYGRKSPLIKRHALHAAALEFEFDNVSYHFTRDIPDDMVALRSYYATTQNS